MLMAVAVGAGPAAAVADELVEAAAAEAAAAAAAAAAAQQAVDAKNPSFDGGGAQPSAAACHSAVASLSFHCPFTVLSLSLDCPFTALSLPFTALSLPFLGPPQAAEWWCGGTWLGRPGRWWSWSCNRCARFKAIRCSQPD